MWRLYGFEPETADPVELWPRRLHPEDRARMRHATAEMLASTDVEFRDEFRIVHPDGEERWLEVVAQVRRDDMGRPLRMTGVNLDITDRKRVEGEREAFAAAAAHDLKTPLTSLKGHTQLLLRRVRRGQAVDISALEAGLGAIDAATGRMLALVEELMDAALLRAGRTLTLDRTPTDLTALTQAAVEEAQQGTSAHTVRLEATAPALVGEWDGVRLARVLGNLLSNAIKYSPNGGGIVVRVDREDDAKGAWAVVAVHDRGIGIPAADLPYLFERFRRGGNVVGRITGSGVGLAGAKQIIEQHGGTIRVTSVEGEGSTFTVRLPLAR
jgi:PAS domain S-box-containing protein